MMKTAVYVYTGTGNSLWAARELANRIGPSELISLNRQQKQFPPCEADVIGLVFPVHIWGVPPPVTKFLDLIKTNPTPYVFAVAVNAGQVAATLIQLKKLLQAKNLDLSCGFSIDLPSNYIPWGGAITPPKQQKKISAALEKIERIAGIVRNKEDLPVEKGPLWQNIFFSLIYKKSLPHIASMDKSFFFDEKCSSCGVCAKICPARNILMDGGKPVWQRRCEQCFACIQWCPEEAIQYGKGTRKKKRYHHPDISLKDMLACAEGKNP
ncbi:MAG: EFR1 family ferrodoxin [Smithellaceae bacterium]|nr:EFR1 family ferrodoxin [Smithellaceae bacterium]